MKKLCLLLALVLALTCVPAFAAEGDAILGISDEETLSFSYCFGIGDTMYLASYADLYAYRVGDADLSVYSYDIPIAMVSESAAMEISTLPFGANGKLYALNLLTAYDEYAQYSGANLAELTLDGETAHVTPICDVDWSEMVEYYDSSSYPIQPDSIVGLGDKAFVRYFDSQGELRTVSIDLATGAIESISELDEAYTITPYRDGTLLAELYNSDVDTKGRFVAYDPQSGSVQPLGEIELTDYTPLMGLAYDAATDTLYCAKGGEICPVDLTAGTVGAGVADMPLDAYSMASGCILDGSYYAFGSSGAVVRNLDPQQKAQSRLKINDTFWVDSVNTAYYRFANAHGDISVVLSREYGEVENLIEGMMNRDDSIDVYVLSTSSSGFEALYNRGYLMDLSGSEKVKALAERMYPSLRDGLSTDGHLVAVPVSVFSWAMGVNEKALTRLGMTLADVPTNWSDFLDFLIALPKVMTEESGVHLFFEGYTAEDARYEMLNTILSDYQYYVDNSNPDLGYDTELMHRLIEKLEQVDFVALGCPETLDDSFSYDSATEDSVLLQTGTGSSIGNFYGDYTPVLLSIDAGAPAYMAMDTTVIVINPYTSNPQAAMAFVEEVLDNLTLQTLYCVAPDLNESVRGEANQAMLDEFQEQLAELTKEYESAGAEDKQDIELDLNETQANMEYAEANYWDVSPRELEWYRNNDDNLVIARYNWLYPDTNEEDDGGIGDGAEASELIEQYLQGQINANELLAGIDRKVQMKKLEGN